MCIKNRRAGRRSAVAREAALGLASKERDRRNVEVAGVYRDLRGGGDAAGSEAHLPLMAAQSGFGRSGNVAGGGNSRDVSTDYNAVRPTAHRVPSGTYQDVVAARNPSQGRGLHPGLMMGMDGEENDVGMDMGRQGR